MIDLIIISTNIVIEFKSMQSEISEFQKNISVAIVEDDHELRALLEMLIDRSPGFECKFVYKSCEEALQTLEDHKPDVVLMDVELPGISGIEGVKKLKPNLETTDFIMLTIREDDETIFQSLSAGATGYLLKDTPPTKLLSSIREVHEGGSPMTPGIARKLTQFFKPNVSPLTERETVILQQLCLGHSYNIIAEVLFISGHTVRNHIKNIYEKLHVHSRGEAVNKAIKDRLV